nr:immunoglobulin heavy chain junction region [Macaca mulatta]
CIAGGVDFSLDVW